MQALFTSLLFSRAPAFLFSALLAIPPSGAQAQSADRPYGTIRGWAITAHFEGARHVACTASIEDGAQDMALSRDDRGFWSVRVPAGQLGTGGSGWVVIDTTEFRSMIDLLGTSAVFPISSDMVDAIRAGSSLHLRDQAGGLSASVPLNGTAAATARIDECFNLGGISPSTPVVAAQGASALEQGTNCPVFGTVASTPGGSLTKVTFVNQTQRPLTLFWIDQTATPQEMVQLNPGGQARLDASTGHVWVVRGLDGQCVGGLIETPATGGSVYLQ